MTSSKLVPPILPPLLMALAVLLGAAAPAAAEEPIPPCLNYVHREEAGRVEVDLRLDPVTGTFSTLTMWWFIDDAGSAPGTYVWNHVVNGRPTTEPQFAVKDDQLHTSLRMIERDGGRKWQWGDIYTLQATHYSPATETTYVAAYNRCRITPRT